MHQKNLKICEFNLENLFVYMDMYTNEDIFSMNEELWKNLTYSQIQFKQKPLFKLKKLAEVIKDINPDIMMLSEVGGLESLENFNHHFLKDEYYIAFIEGNSDRFIHVAYLIHKDVNFQFEVRTNKAKKIKIEEYNKTFEKTFSRDVLELFLYDGDNEDPSLILLTSHLKSQISSDYDPKGHYKRSAEFKALLEIFADLKSQYSCPIVVGGDLNFTLEEKDRDLLTTVGLMEMHQFLNSSELERFTHIFFDFEEKMILNQLDYILFSKDLEDKVVKDSSYTYRFKNYYGEPDELPKTIKEKKLNPSDHYPLVFTIKIG